MVAALIAMAVTYLAFRVTARAEPGTASRGFQLGQTVSASMVALAHGTNDAQKTMGVITLTLITAGMLPPGSAPPFWVVLVRRPGDRARYVHGWLADHPDAGPASQRHPDGRRASPPRPTGAAVILSAAHLGFALSTTQVAAGAVVGSAAGRRAGAVRWRVAGRMVAAWLLTLPAAAAVGAFAAWVAAHGTSGTVLVAAVLVAASVGIYALSRRKPVTAANVNELPSPRPVAVPARAAA